MLAEKNQNKHSTLNSSFDALSKWHEPDNSEKIFSIVSAMPFGQVPALEYDGQVICQSIAIARYVAKENGLAGKDNWTQAQADMVVDCLMDLFYRGLKFYNNTQ